MHMVSRPDGSSSPGNGEGVLRPLPVHVEGQPRRPGGFSTLSEGLDFAARGGTGFNFYAPRGRLEQVLSYADLRERALVTAGRLAAAGIARGDRVAIVAETGPDFMAAFFACQYAGVIPCPMPYPMHIGGRDAYVARIAAMMRAAHVRAALGPADLSGHLADAALAAGVSMVLTHDELRGLPEKAGAIAPFRPDEVAYIQYSSGSTSDPKGVLISQRAICANTRGILEHGMRMRIDDRAFSWLPLYHDMGLVGFCLSPVMGQVTVDYLATPAFARRPVLWLTLMSQNRNTVCYAPSFGYDLAARRVNGKAKELDLSAWRIAGIGGDMVRPEILQAFAEALAPAGFDPKAFLPSYGMAEMSLAISFAELEAPMKVDRVDRAQYKLAGRAVPSDNPDPQKTRVFVSCGRPLPGHELKVVDREGRPLGEREIGHIWVKGPSMMDGYYRNPEATAEVMREDGFMDTGDMGYLLDGEIVITGRAKDLILYHGRNIWPQDIEWAAEQVEPLRSGDVAAFALEGNGGHERVVVLAQCRLKDPEEMEDLRTRISAAVHRAVGVECDIVLVPPKSLPFTSSGKLSRSKARAMFLAGEIPPLRVSGHDGAELQAAVNA